MAYTTLMCKTGSSLHLQAPSRAVQCMANRRQLLAGLSAMPLTDVAATPAQAMGATSSRLQEAEQPSSSSSSSSSSRTASCSRMDPRVAAQLLNAVSTSVVALQLADEQEFQMERFKLQQREYRYYFEANADQLPRVPDLSDSSGGLSNRTYFNFVSYVAWKVAARYAASPEQRRQLVATAGQQLLQQLAPDLEQQLHQQAAAGGGRATAQQLVAACQGLLGRLQAAGYICAYQLTWGGLPGGWAADWASEPGVQGDPVEPEALPAAFPFQVKLQLPADIQGSVALRAEEEGFFGRHISSMLVQLLASGGYGNAAADEYFYQDYWSGPQKVADKVLLLLGDPLQQVEVPWTPETLVQNWTLN